MTMEPVRAPQAEKPRLERERQPERRREQEPLGGEQAAVPLAGLAGAAQPHGQGGLPAGMLHLQRLYGNRHVQRLVALAREDPAMLQGGEVSGEIESGIQAARGGGQPLDSGARASLEPAFGVDFGNVRVHTGSQADQLNRDLSARAFTTGSDIFFRQGEYRPGSSSGRELLAHELTHVVQQGGAAGAAPEGETQAKLTVGAVDDPFEREADSVARAVMDDERRDSGTVRRMPIVQRVPAVQRKKKKSTDYPVKAAGATFEGAAADFAFQYQAVLSADGLLDWAPTTAVIITNGGNVRIFTGAGKAVGGGRTFRFKRPVDLPVGVYRSGPTRALQPMLQADDGAWVMADYTVKGSGDFAADIDGQEDFDALLKQFQRGFYVVPRVLEQDIPTAEAAEAGGGDAQPDKAATPEAAPAASQTTGKPPEEKPEFLKIEATGKADLPAWPAAVIPITSPVTAVGSVGTFVCRLDKYNPWAGLLANVTNNLEPMAFAWEVLELGNRFTVESKDTATRLKGAIAGYEVRARHLEEDEKTRLGEGQKQGIPEKVFRAFFNEQIKDQRAILGYAGQTVLTVVKTFAGQPDNPRIEDIIDYKFDKPGNYFVRCLANPIVPTDKANVKKRATSVSGVMVSVFDIQSLAEGSLATAESEQKDADKALKDLAAELDWLKEIQSSKDPKELAKHPILDYEIWRADQAVLAEKKLREKAGDAHARLQIEIDFLRLQVDRLSGKDAPKPPKAEHQKMVQSMLKGLEAELKRLEGQVERADSKLGGAKRTGTMPAVLVDDTTGNRINLLFSIGEHTRINTDELEVVIADITGEKGRLFTGTGSGWQGEGRSEAWTLAMRDLRRNLGHGRGWLAFRAPEPYASLKEAAVDNPMQLQIAELDQLKETVDDAAHAVTLAALVAAPFTGGASLSVLAVLAPIQAGSSLYNIVNRAMYDDLHLDAEAIGDIANIATLGLAKVGPAGKFATSGARLFATGGRIAFQVFDKGQYLVIGWSTWQALTAEEPPGTDPREAQARKVMALLSLLEAGAIPVASHLWPGGTRPKPAEMPQHPWTAAANEAAAKAAPETAGASPSNAPHAAQPEGGAPKKAATPEEGTRPDEGKVKPDEGSRAATPTPTAAAQVPDSILKVLPPDVQKNAPPVMNPDLKPGAVHIEYEVDFGTGVIKSLRMEIGPGTHPDRVAAHVETARVMAQYKGLSGRVRLVFEQISAWVKGHPQAVPGTRAWEARLEVKKLGLLILRRAGEYQNATPEIKEQLRKELDDLQSQFLQHASEVDLYDTGGLGYVAVESKSLGAEKARAAERKDPEPGYFWVWKAGKLEYKSKDLTKYPKRRWNDIKKDFEPDTGNADENPIFEATTARGALDELGAYDYTPGTTGEAATMSEMRRFIELLIQEGFIQKPDDLIPYVPEFAGLRHRNVRHKIKEPFQARLLDRATDPKRLKTLPAYEKAIQGGADPATALRTAAHEELLRISEGLPSSDRGSFGESWYERIYPPSDPKKAYTQVEVEPAQINPQLPAEVTPFDQSRRIDSLRNQAVFEIKNISGSLSTHGRGQIEDMAKLLGSEVLVPGDVPAGKTVGPPVPKKVKVDQLVVVFPDPAGAQANITWATGFLEAHPNANIEIQYLNSRGETAKVGPKQRKWIAADPGGLKDWLAGNGQGPPSP